MRVRRAIIWLGLVILMLAWVSHAQAVIKIERPVSEVYQYAKQVIVATIIKANPANRVIEAEVVEVVKGKAVGERIRVQIVQPEAIFKQVKAGQPVVIFVSKAAGDSAEHALHLADTWLVAHPRGELTPATWAVVQDHPVMNKSFPGTTPALVRLIAELKAGKNPVLNAIEDKIFTEGAKKLGTLAVTHPESLLAADLDGDGAPELIVNTSNGSRAFAKKSEIYEDVTEKLGLNGAGKIQAVGDINGDGKTDIIAGNKVWINEGGKFMTHGPTLDLPDPQDLLAITIAVTGQKSDLFAIKKNGELLTWENSGSVDQPHDKAKTKTLWTGGEAVLSVVFGGFGDAGETTLMVVREETITRYSLSGDVSTPADFTRLTGERWSSFVKENGNKLKGVTARPIDINGDGRTDLMIVGDAGGLLLANRGFGAFLVSADAAGTLRSKEGRSLPFTLSPTSCWTAVKLRGDKFEDVLVLTPDGNLYVMPNPPHTGH